MRSALKIVLIFWLGWFFAHLTVAAECQRLGGFFIGEQTYHCTPELSE
ncbi:hypothetical protein VQ643_04270 [Pseudomonas sp. F1_0610]